MAVAEPDSIHRMGVKRRELIPLASEVNAANVTSLPFLGGLLVSISGTGKDETKRHSEQRMYVAENIKGDVPIKNCLCGAGHHWQGFPTIGTFPGNSLPTNQAVNTINNCSMVDPDSPDKWLCPKRTLPPPVPDKLLFPQYYMRVWSGLSKCLL